MSYPVIAVSGRVNGGLHEILTVERLMKECDKSPTDDKAPKIWKSESIHHLKLRQLINNVHIPCTVKLTSLLFIGEASHNILVLLYCDEAIAVRFLLIILSSGSMSCSLNPLFFIALSLAEEPFTRYVTFVAPLAVQVNSTVVPLTAVKGTGLTRKT